MNRSNLAMITLSGLLVLSSCYRGEGTVGPADVQGIPVWPAGLIIPKSELTAASFNGVYAERTKRSCCWLAPYASLRTLVQHRPKHIYLDFFQPTFPEPREPLIKRIQRMMMLRHKPVPQEKPQVVTVIFSRNHHYVSPPLADGFAELAIEVPADAKIQDGMLLFDLRMSKSVVPKDVDPNSQDPRLLAILFRGVDHREDVPAYQTPNRRSRARGDTPASVRFTHLSGIGRQN